MEPETPVAEGDTVGSVDEDRYVLHSKVRGVLGAREGDILMEHLPPAGWQHLATRQDLETTALLLGSDLRTEIERGFRSQTWKLVSALIASHAVMLTAMGFMINSTR